MAAGGKAARWRLATARPAQHGREGGGRLRLGVEARGGGSSAAGARGGWLRLVVAGPVAEAAGSAACPERQRRPRSLARPGRSAPAHGAASVAAQLGGRAAGMPPRWPGEARRPDFGGAGGWRRSGAAAPPAARWQCKGSWRRWAVFLVAGRHPRPSWSSSPSLRGVSRLD
uniref:Uncharacterized protein n=1 Tax=Oryza rufipogon TaxID=4529 RepID=A0A0E0P637_ORYRU